MDASGFRCASAACKERLALERDCFFSADSQRKKKIPASFTPQTSFFTLRPCDARFVFWPGDCWCWKGSTGQLQFCNNMTHRPADISSLFASSWKLRSLFLRLRRGFNVVSAALGVLGRFSSDRSASLVFSSLLTSAAPFLSCLFTALAILFISKEMMYLSS